MFKPNFFDLTITKIRNVVKVKPSPIYIISILAFILIAILVVLFLNLI